MAQNGMMFAELELDLHGSPVMWYFNAITWAAVI